MKKLFIIIVFVAAAAIFIPGFKNVDIAKKDPVDYVNPYMGNISHLLVPTYPTVHLPNSFLRIYPDRGDFTGRVIRGLPVILTSHRGSFAFNISPFQGNIKGTRPVIPYTYDLEKITPYSWSVYLDQQQIGVKFAPSHQSAVYNLDFNNKDSSFLVINSRNGRMKWNGEAITGYQVLQGNTRVYIWLETESKPIKVAVLRDGKIFQDSTETSGSNASVVLSFGDKAQLLRIRYGISFIGSVQAKKNLEREIKSFAIEPLLADGRKIWNESLGKTLVEGGSDEEKAVFYTSVYRTYERPVSISEDGRYYSAFDGKVHDDNGTPFYTDDWIWDTYRAAHPLRVLTEPRMEENILNSFIQMSEQSENYWMPTFPGITGDGHAMNCNHGVASFADAYVKGLTGINMEKVYKACKGAITEKTLSPWSDKPAGVLDRFYIENGYFPALREGETETIPEVHSFEKRQAVAVTLGTSYDDWCLSQIARALGKADDYKYFLKQSYNYRNLFNPATGFFHPKDRYGEFIQPFDYKFSGGAGNRDYYDENNGWTYKWEVQHNIGDLVQLMGGKETFAANMDALFTEPLGRSKYQFYAQLPDQTGNVGQFTMANEPSFHIPYLYNYAGEPWKTQKCIRSLLSAWYRNDLMGVPGDEDGGGMSAFVVFSMMGFYPVTPGMPYYNIGSPVFSGTIIKLNNGKEFRIIAKNSSDENKYIQSAKLNGRVWNKPWFSHNDIKDGAILELEMGNKANRQWGSSPDASPPSAESIDLAQSQSTESIPTVTKKDSSRLITVLSPAYWSDINGNTLIRFNAPGAKNALVKCWINDALWGHDSIFPVVDLDYRYNGIFLFPADRFPHGPVSIRISTGDDQCNLQVYNTGGIPWKEGIPAPPPQAAGMTIAFQDDFSGPLSISSTGVGQIYSSRHIDGNFGRLPFADYESQKNPFSQRDSYLRIRADVNKGSTGLISTRRSDSTYSCAVRYGYFECRFIAPLFNGSWPAFWGCTARGRTPETRYCDEIDVIEAYANAPDKYETNWHIWAEKHTAAPKVQTVPMTDLGGKSNWSTTPHVYGVMIKEDTTRYYLDNILVWQHPTTPHCKTKPFYFMINLALGGGRRSYDLTRYNNIADMYVDYVRVFQFNP